MEGEERIGRWLIMPSVALVAAVLLAGCAARDKLNEAVDKGNEALGERGNELLGGGQEAPEDWGNADKVAHVKVTPVIADVAVGEILALTATAYDAAGNAVQGVYFHWGSSDPVELVPGADPYNASMGVRGRSSGLPGAYGDSDAIAYVAAKGGKLFMKGGNVGPMFSGNANLRVVPGGEVASVAAYPQEMTLAVGEGRHVVAFAYTTVNGKVTRIPRSGLDFECTSPSVQLSLLDGSQAYVRGVKEGEATVTVGSAGARATVHVKVVPAGTATAPVYARDAIPAPKRGGGFGRIVLGLGRGDAPHIAFTAGGTGDLDDLFYATWTGTGWDVSLVAPYLSTYFSMRLTPDGRPAITYTDWFGQPYLALYDPGTGRWGSELVQSGRELGHWALPTIVGTPAFDRYARGSPTDVAFDAQGIPHVAFDKLTDQHRSNGPSLNLLTVRRAYKQEGRWVVEDVAGPIGDGSFGDRSLARKMDLLVTREGLEMLQTRGVEEGGGNIVDHLFRMTKAPGAETWTTDDLGPYVGFEAFTGSDGNARRIAMRGDARSGVRLKYSQPGQPDEEAPAAGAAAGPDDSSACLDSKDQPHLFAARHHIYRLPGRGWRRTPSHTRYGQDEPDSKPVSAALDSKDREVFACVLPPPAGSARRLFAWGRVPGEDEAKLKRFLMEELGLAWADTARIEKLGDRGQNLRLSSGDAQLTITLADDRRTAALRTNTGREESFEVRTEGGELYLHGGREPSAITLYSGRTFNGYDSTALEMPGPQVAYELNSEVLVVRQFADGEVAVLSSVDPWKNETVDDKFKAGLVFTKTRDGAAFTAPVRVDAWGIYLAAPVDMRIVGDTVYVVYRGGGRMGPGDDGGVGYLAVSTDRGATFSAPRDPFPPAPSGYGGGSVTTMMAVDKDGYIYLFSGYANTPQGTRTMSLVRSRDGGRTFEFLPGPDEPATNRFTPTKLLALPNGDLAMVGPGRDDPSGPIHLRYTYSTDHGGSWSPFGAFTGLQLRVPFDALDALQDMANGDLYALVSTQEWRPGGTDPARNYTYSVHLCHAGTWACAASATVPKRVMGGINPSFLHGHVTELPSGRYLSVTLQDRGGSEIVYNGATELMNSTVHLWKLDGAAASGSFALDRGKYPGFYAESAKRDLQVAELGGKLWGLWLDDRARLDMDTVKYNEHVFLGEVKAA